MKRLIFLFLICAAVSVRAQDSEKEKAVRAYYSGFENHDWNTVASQFADGFTFTTPLDDHINLEKYHEDCWDTNKFFKKVNLVRMIESGDTLTLLVEINTTDNKVVRNVDVFSFSAGKIKSIEVFFGRGVSFPGNKNSPPLSPKP